MKTKFTVDALVLFEKIRTAALNEYKENLKIAKNARLQNQELQAKQAEAEIQRISAINLDNAFVFYTAQAVSLVEQALIYLKEPKNQKSIFEVLENKFKYDNSYLKGKAYSLFSKVLSMILTHQRGLKGNVTYNIEESQEVYGNTLPSRPNTTTFSTTLVNQGIIEQDYITNFLSDNCQEFLRTMIHESVHRLNILKRDMPILNLITKEVYEKGEDHKRFSELSCDEHLNNADSYTAFTFDMREAYLRLVGYSMSVETGVVEAVEVKTIYKGDTLWGLAEIYYGDGMQWKKIWNENKDTLKSGNPNRIYPGEIIRIRLE